MKLGVLLPTFRSTADDALATAERAAHGGLDGVFAFDHLWPMGSPTRPALAPFPVLAAVATSWTNLTVGPLVARVGLVGVAKLIEQFTTLDALAPGRVIAALGTGDHLSRDEQLAYGLGYPSASERRSMLNDVAIALPSTMTLWVGAGSTETNQLARHVGATINLWGMSPEEVAEAAKVGPVSWAGPLGDDATTTLSALAAAGATWAVASEASRLDELFGVASHQLTHYGLRMEFRRVTGLPPYVFAQINGAEGRARAHGRDVIDFGFGNPDLPSPDVAVEKLGEAAHNPKNHRYSASRGIPNLRLAIAQRYKRAL